MKQKKAAIYHITKESKQRPKTYLDKLTSLNDFAISLGFDITDTYCDMSIKRCERIEFDRFLSKAEDYEALIVQDFFHISKNTMQCMRIMSDLRSKGVTIYTLNNGYFQFEDEPFDTQLKVATYNCRFGTINEIKEIIPIANDVLNLFSTKKTRWTVVDQYFDESEHQNDGEQKELQLLIANREKYDLLLVHNLNNVHWRTANFCKIRESLQLDIYSLQDGFLKYRKEF